MSKTKSTPGYYPASNPNSITAQLDKENETELADLYDFYHYCVRRWPDLFKRLTIEQFKRWNDERISALNRDRPHREKHEVRREIEANTIDRCVGHWCKKKKAWSIHRNECDCS